MGKTILLFDVDGTLTAPRQKITNSMRDFMAEIREVVPVGVVGGSDLSKIVEQLGADLDDLLSQYDYVFSENGLVGFCRKVPVQVQSIKEEVGEERLKKLINFTLKYFSEIDLPVKRGNFIEFRNGMLNLSPIGRSCSQSERLEFVEYDSIHKVRERFVRDLEDFTRGWNLRICIGGQISVDVFPNGWDKTFCLKYLTNYENIHFFGDKTDQGGNDYDIFIDSRTIGHSVRSPEDTKEKVTNLLNELKN